MADLDKNQQFNLFSEKSKELIRSMGNMEYFEMCEITSKVQCQDFSLYREMRIVYCLCGKCLQPSERHRQLNKDRYDVYTQEGKHKRSQNHIGQILERSAVSRLTKQNWMG